MPAPGGAGFGDDGLPHAGQAVTVDAAGEDLGQRLDQTIVILA